MKVFFETRLEGIDWIADHAEDEGQFEVWREELVFNHIYTGKYFLETGGRVDDVIVMPTQWKSH